MSTKEKFWIEDKGTCWDLYVYVPKMWSYYHIFRASDRAGICEYMTRRHLAGTIRESVAAVVRFPGEVRDVLKKEGIYK